MNDIQALRSADAVRRDALVDAIATNGQRLHRLALRMLDDHHAADDAVQEACLRALQALPRFRGDASYSTWLHHITANVCLDERRRRRRRPAVPYGPDDDGGQPSCAGLPSAADFSDASAVGTDLARALADLPPSQRNALLLTDGLGFEYAEAGALLGVARGTIGSRVHRAKGALRAHLAEAA